MCEGCVPREVFEEVIGELREEFTEQIEQLREEINEEIEQLREEIEQQGETMGKNVEGLHNRVSALRDELAEPSGESDEVRHPDDPRLFDLLATPESQLDPTDRRLSWLWRELEDYTTRTPAGRVIDASDLRRVLQARESSGVRIESNQVGRVMKRAEELTRGAVRIERRPERNERLLLVPDDWLSRARDAATDHSGGTDQEGTATA